MRAKQILPLDVCQLGLIKFGEEALLAFVECKKLNRILSVVCFFRIFNVDPTISVWLPARQQTMFFCPKLLEQKNQIDSTAVISSFLEHLFRLLLLAFLKLTKKLFRFKQKTLYKLTGVDTVPEKSFWLEGPTLLLKTVKPSRTGHRLSNALAGLPYLRCAKTRLITLQSAECRVQGGQRVLRNNLRVQNNAFYCSCCFP